MYKLFLRRTFEEKQHGTHRPRSECKFGFFGKRDWKELWCLKIMFTNKMFVPICLKVKGTLTLISLSTGFSSCFSSCILTILSHFLPFSSPIPSMNRFHFFPTSDNTNYSTHFKTLKDFSICYLNVFMQISVHFCHPLVTYANYILPLFTIILEKFLTSKARTFCSLLCKYICRKPFNLQKQLCDPYFTTLSYF
jgi:hypothetical protein